MLRKAITFLSGLVPFTTLAAQGQIPNVLLVVADDVGVDGIGCYGLGSNPANTPNIDALAATGVRFLNAQACPLCSPTRASILTGRHGFRTGIGKALSSVDAGLSLSEVTLPELLEGAGIQTALIGKWHLGESQTWQTPTMIGGFGTFVGSLGGALADYSNWQKVNGGPAVAHTDYATTDAVDDAITFVTGATEPWFLMLSFNAGHSPYHVPPAVVPPLHTVPAPLNSVVKRYRAMVEAMDTELGRLLTSIPAATLAATNIVFMGDNGTASAVVELPFIAAQSKGTVYQGGVHVPLIVAGPVVGGAPRTEPSLVHAVDLFATIAAMQGVDVTVAVPPPVRLDAVDATSLLAAAMQPQVRHYSYSQEFTGATAMATTGDSEMIRTLTYSLLRFQDGTTASDVREEMYELIADPFEQAPLDIPSLTGTAAAIYRELKRELALLRGYAWADAYGTGCTFCGVAPALAQAAATSPRIGSSWNLQVTGLTASVPATLVGIGFQNDTFAGLSLPLELAVLGAPGCWLRIDPALTTVLGPATPTASMSIVLPNDPTVVGASLFVQAFPLLTGCAASSLLATNAIEAIVGT